MKDKAVLAMGSREEDRRSAGHKDSNHRANAGTEEARKAAAPAQSALPGCRTEELRIFKQARPSYPLRDDSLCLSLQESSHSAHGQCLLLCLLFPSSLLSSPHRVVCPWLLTMRRPAENVENSPSEHNRTAYCRRIACGLHCG